MLSANTNVAVDRVLEQLVGSRGGCTEAWPEVARVGRLDRVAPTLRSRLVVHSGAGDSVASQIQAILKKVCA